MIAFVQTFPLEPRNLNSFEPTIEQESQSPSILEMRSRAILIAVASVFSIACAVIIFWPDSPLDLSEDEEPFRSIIMPPKAVFGDYYMDGGSIGVRIIDRAGTTHDVTFPIEHGKIGNPYPAAYHGAINDSGMVLLKNPERAKVIVIRLLKSYGTKVSAPGFDEYDGPAVAIRALSNPTYVKVLRIADKAKRFFEGS